MKNRVAQLGVLAGKIDRRHIQFILAIISLAILVLGIGAPNDGGVTPH